ncbi:MAG TPA: hypothetical protein DCM23_02645 [Firmicutes bacterium]|jgi:hypothetical protein|nr:hypothetical protein [Bacillota bacterium]HAV19470.1 hypothetical protein [Bacillota bacterium]
MKLKIPPIRVARPYIIFGLILGVFFYIIPGFAWPPTSSHYFIMTIWLITTLGYIIIGIFTSYYVIEKDGIIQHRFTKSYIFHFEEIVFVDRPYTDKKKTLRFITDTGDIRYLLLDYEAKIYDAVLKHCTLLSEQDFKVRFPNIKI